MQWDDPLQPWLGATLTDGWTLVPLLFGQARLLNYSRGKTF